MSNVANGAARFAIKACQDLRQRDPAFVRWLEDGHPNLTDDEHFRRFGFYHPSSKKKR